MTISYLSRMYGMTNYHIEMHQTTSDHIWLNWRRLHLLCTACIAVVNHALAPNCRKCLTFFLHMMLVS